MKRSSVRRVEEMQARRMMLVKEEDGELVKKFLRGDERALTTLVERYQTRLLNFIYHMIGDRERAEDLVQETFMRVYRHAHRFDQSRSFSVWVYTIAGNFAKNELRNRGRNRLVLFQAMEHHRDDDDRELQFEDPRLDLNRIMEKNRLRDLVAKAIAAMPENHRQIFVLREIEGKNYDEIADITHTRLGTVKSRLNRARNAFAAIIEPHI